MYSPFLLSCNVTFKSSIFWSFLHDTVRHKPHYPRTRPHHHPPTEGRLWGKTGTNGENRDTQRVRRSFGWLRQKKSIYAWMNAPKHVHPQFVLPPVLVTMTCVGVTPRQSHLRSSPASSVTLLVCFCPRRHYWVWLCLCCAHAQLLFRIWLFPCPSLFSYLEICTCTRRDFSFDTSFHFPSLKQVPIYSIVIHKVAGPSWWEGGKLCLSPIGQEAQLVRDVSRPSSGRASRFHKTVAPPWE